MSGPGYGSPVSLFQAGLVFVIASLVLVGAVAATTPELPDPLSGPGVGEIKRSQSKKIDRAWRELLTGNIRESRKRIARVKASPPEALVRAQILLGENDAAAVDHLKELCEQQDGYAAAWITLSLAAEKNDLEALAMEAAARAAVLWPGSPWSDREGELTDRWVDGRIEQAELWLDEERIDEAISELLRAQALAPQRNDITLLMAKAHLSAGDEEEANTLLEELPTVPEAVFLRGTIAESRAQWQYASELYSSLPNDFPGREHALQNAQLRWRLTLLPSFARTALSSTELTRSELASVLVATQPRLKTLPGGTVPVMSDIVDNPAHRDIITVVRLGILQADRRGHLYQPDALVDAELVRTAVDRSKILLGLPPTPWCAADDMVVSGCHSIPSPPTGDAVMHAMLDSTPGADR